MTPRHDRKLAWNVETLESRNLQSVLSPGAGQQAPPPGSNPAIIEAGSPQLSPHVGLHNYNQLTAFGGQ
jgi:hypothetical protein